MSIKDETIIELQEIMLQKADELRKDNTMIPEEKLEKLDVIFNIYKILSKYDYNIELLQKDLILKKGGFDR